MVMYHPSWHTACKVQEAWAAQAWPGRGYDESPLGKRARGTGPRSSRWSLSELGAGLGGEEFHGSAHELGQAAARQDASAAT